MRFQADEVSPAEKQTFEQWLNEDALHLAAWKRAEEVMQTFSMTPSMVGRHTLSTLSPASITKNRALRLLGIASTMMPLLNFLVRGDVSEI